MHKRLILFALLGFTLGCGGGPPRKPVPPSERHKAEIKREKFKLLGVRDEWYEPLPIIDGLQRLGGVLEVFQDETDGKFVVVFNPQRTHRDAIRVKLLEIGQEQGRKWEPVFDDR